MIFFKNMRKQGVLAAASFWCWTVLGILPVGTHWTAGLLDSMGFQSAGAALDAQRYASPAYAVAACVVVAFALLAWGAVRVAWPYWRKNLKGN